VIDAAVAKGVAIVVAAGNDGVDLRYAYPANCRNVIRVTATNKDGTFAGYSNYGSTGFSATVAAPGTEILSTGFTATGSESYVRMTGTSMSAPHISGTLALMRAANPALTNTHRLNLLTGSAQPLAGGCSAIKCGAGIANAKAAVAAAVTATADLTIGTPTWSETTKVGYKLTARAAASLPKAALSWQWLRDGVAISGATRVTYTPTDVDNGRALSVRVSGRYDGATTTVTSSPVTVTALAFGRLARPKVNGAYKVGHKLKVKAGAVKPAASRKTYRWLRNGKPIAKAKGSSYRLTRADRHKKISARVTVTRPGYLSRSATSSSRRVK
jgi:serine protease